MRLPWQKAKVGKPALTGGTIAPDPSVSAPKYLEWQLKEYKFRDGAPIWEIMRRPNNLFEMYHAQEETLLKRIMENVYAYGRRNWTWVAAGGKDSTMAHDPKTHEWIENLPWATQQVLQQGRGLLDGTTRAGACGNFNTAFQFVARRIFNVPLEAGQQEGRTTIGGNFITMPGSEVIDSHWVGNVWTDNLDNDQLRAFEFNGHWFCNYKGTIYDVTSNRTFKSTHEMIWCRLDPVGADVKAKFRGGPDVSVYKVRGVSKALQPTSGKHLAESKTIGLRQYCIKIGREKLSGGSGGFSNWLLTDRTELSALEMKRFATRSSRR